MAKNRGRDMLALNNDQTAAKSILASVRGGMGQNVISIEQTALNLPQEEIDRLSLQYREMLENLFRVARLKVRELLSDKEARARTHLKEISDSVVSFQQIYQMLAGYTTKTAKIEIEAIHQELERIRRDRAFLREELDAIVQTLEKKKALARSSNPEGAMSTEEALLEGKVLSPSDVVVTTPAGRPLDYLASNPILRSRVRDALIRGYMRTTGELGPIKAPLAATKWLFDTAEAVRLSQGVHEEELELLGIVFNQETGRYEPTTLSREAGSSTDVLEADFLTGLNEAEEA